MFFVLRARSPARSSLAVAKHSMVRGVRYAVTQLCRRSPSAAWSRIYLVVTAGGA